MEAHKILQSITLSVIASVSAWWLVQHAPKKCEPAPLVQPIVRPDDEATRRKHPHLPRLPWRRDAQGGLIGTIREGGPLGPDGKTEVTCDIPVSERMKNVGGRDGAGLCVFTSIMHNARFQNESRLFNFQADMRKELGGGYRDKVDRMIAKYAKGTPYMQYEGNSPAILKLAIKTGRPVGVTYNGHDVHYGNQTIAHMVSLVGYDEQADLAVILDNNFIGPDQLVWMTCGEFLQRWKGGQQGWAVVLLSPPPPPPPH